MPDLSDLEEELKGRLERLDAIAALQRSRGWKYLFEHIEAAKLACIKSILIEQSPQKVTQLQERYRAHNELLEAVASAAKERERVAQELQNIVEEREYRETYALN